MSLIPAQEYAAITEVLPILCVDVVVQNVRGEYLLVKRANEPRKGQWWVVGGRVLKGESLHQAALRKVREETALYIGSAEPIGYYEELAQVNPFRRDAQYHAVSVVFAAAVDDFREIRLDDQSAEWKRARELPADFCIRSFDHRDLGGE